MADKAFTLSFGADVSEFADAVNKLPTTVSGAVGSIVSRLTDIKTVIGGLAATITAGMGFRELLEQGANMDKAFQSLAVTSKQFGVSLDSLKDSADKLSADSQIGFSEAASSLNRLVKAGYSVEQATALLGRFKDAAAFGRREGESFSAAVDNMTNAVIRGNDRLLKTYGVFANFGNAAEDAGLKTNDLRNAMSSAEARATIFSDVMRATERVVGNAAITAKTYEGETNRLKDSIQDAAGFLGQTLTPVMTALASKTADIAGKVRDWIFANQDLIKSKILEWSKTLADALVGVIRFSGDLAEGFNKVAMVGKLAFGGLLVVVGHVTDGIIDGLMFIPEWTLKIVGTIVEYFSKGVYSIINLFSGIADKLNIGGVLDGVIAGLDKAKYAVEAYGEGFGNMLAGIGKDAGEVGNKVQQTLDAVADKFIGSAVGNVNAIGSYSEAANNAAEAFGEWSGEVIELAGRINGALAPALSAQSSQFEASTPVVDNAAKILADYNAKMEHASIMARLFNEENKLVEQQMSLTQNAVRQLVEQGLDPADVRIQNLVNRFNQMKQSMSMSDSQQFLTGFMDSMGLKFDEFTGKIVMTQNAFNQFGQFLGNSIMQASQAVGQAFANMIFGGQKFSEAMKQLGKQIVGQFFSMISQMLVQLAIGWALQRVLGLGMASAMIGQQAGIAFATAYAPLAAVPPAAMAAGLAAAGVTMSVGNSIASASSAVPAMASGGIVPGPVGSAQPIIAHGGEMVLNPEQQRALFDGETEGLIGGGTTLNVSIHAIDSRSFYDMLQSTDGQRALVQVIEDGGPVARAIETRRSV